MAIAIKLSANQALALSDAAARLQVRETELAAADTEEWLQQVEALRAGSRVAHPGARIA